MRLGLVSQSEPLAVIPWLPSSYSYGPIYRRSDISSPRLSVAQPDRHLYDRKTFFLDFPIVYIQLVKDDAKNGAVGESLPNCFSLSQFIYFSFS